jgi:hypothetical protein
MEDDDTPGEHPDTGLLPTPERIDTMTNSELRELRDLLAADWEGPAVEAFRARVAERLGETEADDEARLARSLGNLPAEEEEADTEGGEA